MDSKQLIESGVEILIICFIYKVLAPLINWIIYIVPTIAIIMIIVGIIKSYSKH